MFGLISSFLSNRQLQVILDGKFSQEYPVNVGVLQGSIHGPTLFLLYINDLPDDTTLYCKCDQASDLRQQLELTSELESIYKTLSTRAGKSLLISMVEKFNWFCLTGLITLVLLTCKWMGLCSRKNHLLKDARVDLLFYIEFGLLHYLYC